MATVLTLEKIDELSELMGFDFTQEGMQECYDRYGIGCKACDVQVTEVGWFYLVGDTYCFACAYRLDQMAEADGEEASSEILPTRDQLRQQRAWAAAGIGAD